MGHVPGIHWAEFFRLMIIVDRMKILHTLQSLGQSLFSRWFRALRPTAALTRPVCQDSRKNRETPISHFGRFLGFSYVNSFGSFPSPRVFSTFFHWSNWTLPRNFSAVTPGASGRVCKTRAFCGCPSCAAERGWGWVYWQKRSQFVKWISRNYGKFMIFGKSWY